MTEIVFVVKAEPDGGFTAEAANAAIVTQADTLEQLRQAVRDAVNCHFPDDGSRPRAIRCVLPLGSKPD